MSSAKRLYNNSEIDNAGDILKANDPNHPENNWAEYVLTNWRSIHSYPINTFQATLREKLKLIDKQSFIAQRLKRSESIISKLLRIKTMRLSSMQDIAGLRAVVSSIENVHKLNLNYKNSIFLHKIIGEKDYINKPKSSGYRGIHLIFQYHNAVVPDYNGLKIELQIRTKLQHIWATTVETVGTFLNYSLKSSEGPDEWLDYFVLVSSAFAYIEKCRPIDKYLKLSLKQTFKEVVRISKKLDIEKKLSAFTVAAKSISQDNKQGHFHLIILNMEKRLLSIRNYGRKRFDEANNDYTVIEKQIKDGHPLQAVLVSTGSIDNLRKAYPNYFLDTKEFINKLNYIESQI